jgi:GNAT superfamily N-acetyltransferase
VHDVPRDYRRGDFVVSTDRERLDFDLIHGFLSRSYWAEGMPKVVLQRAIENSLCFGMFDRAQQVGFARAITDLATYAYLSDVFVVEGYRGRGLGRWMIECILTHPDLQGVRRIALFTRDAQGLYSQLGFGASTSKSEYMEIRNPGVYGSAARREGGPAPASHG